MLMEVFLKQRANPVGDPEGRMIAQALEVDNPVA